MAEEFKVEKGIPPIYQTNPRCKYPWDSMEVGDSFLIPNIGKAQGASALLSAKTRAGRFNKPYKYVGAAVEGGYRIWRVE